jgi:hypothetical protein
MAEWDPGIAFQSLLTRRRAQFQGGLPGEAPREPVGRGHKLCQSGSNFQKAERYVRQYSYQSFTDKNSLWDQRGDRTFVIALRGNFLKAAV